MVKEKSEEFRDKEGYQYGLVHIILNQYELNQLILNMIVRIEERIEKLEQKRIHKIRKKYKKRI